MRPVAFLALVALLLATAAPLRPLHANEPASLKYYNATLDILLDDYSEKTGRTVLLAPNLPKPTFTVTSQGDLSPEEYLQAIETLLSMHEIGLVPVGDRFLQVVPIRQARRTGLDIREDTAQTLVSGQSGELISQMIVLKHITIAEATKAIDPLRQEFGTVNPFERTNSLLVTDTADTIQRMLQVLRMIDQPAEAREEPRIIQIRFARATDIKAKLEELIKASQDEEQQRSTVPRARDSGSPGVVPTSPPGVIRARTARPEAVADEGRLDALIELAERGIIRGRVQIVADERTNQLIIITRPENMSFFERVIDVLDIETTPDVTVEVIRLDFADAEQVATMLNTLIGATARDDEIRRSPDEGGDDRRGIALREFERREAVAALPAEQKSKVGELSKENITILSDKRTNALIIMARKSDLQTMREIIRDMDMMLAQVLIEAVIIDVSLDDSLETGVSWIQKSMTAYERDSATGQRTPLFAFAGGGGGGGRVPLDADGLRDPGRLATGGLGYYFTLFDLNINAVLHATASDNRSRVVSTPVLLTTDNEEATLSSTERIYVFEGTTFVGTSTDSRTARYRQEDVGLTLTVKPQINENHVVMMNIKQEISEPGDVTGLNTDNLTGQRISINRTLEAKIAVQSGQTIVLGGQVRESSSRRREKVPLLGDLPLLGRLFSLNRQSSGRTETIVFITPYVLDSPDAASAEARRRRDALNIGGMWKQGWSGSELAEPAEAGGARRQEAARPMRPAVSAVTAPPRGAAPAAARPRPVQGGIDAFIRDHEDTWLEALDPVP